MNVNDSMVFADEAKVELGTVSGFVIGPKNPLEITLESKVRQRIANSPLDKILDNLKVQDPYADIGK